MKFTDASLCLVCWIVNSLFEDNFCDNWQLIIKDTILLKACGMSLMTDSYPFIIDERFVCFLPCLKMLNYQYMAGFYKL
jgi:hypothetical protein